MSGNREVKWGEWAAGQVQPAAHFVAGLAPLRPIQGILLKGTAGGPARLRRGPAFGTGALSYTYPSRWPRRSEGPTCASYQRQ